MAKDGEGTETLLAVLSAIRNINGVVFVRQVKQAGKEEGMINFRAFAPFQHGNGHRACGARQPGVASEVAERKLWRRQGVGYVVKIFSCRPRMMAV